MPASKSHYSDIKLQKINPNPQQSVRFLPPPENQSVRFFVSRVFGQITEAISTIVENSGSTPEDQKSQKKSKKPLAFLKNMSYNKTSATKQQKR